MKVPLAVLTAVLLLVPVAPCAGKWYSPPPGSLEGEQAVQFSVSSWLTLTAFQGQMFSYQRFLSDSRAFRVAGGVGLDLDKSDFDISYEDGGQTGAAEESDWNHSVTLKVQMLFYRGDGPIRFFWGAGPKVSYSDLHSEDVNYSPYGDELAYIYYTGDSDKWELGLQGFAGAEWFISEMFSLHAEYAVSGMYAMTDTDERRIYSHDPGSNRSISVSSSSWEFDSDGVRFGLSARF
jgi:hypothetical protein